MQTRTSGPRTEGANPAGRYRVRNWKEYDKALQRRGEITLWVDQDSLAAWKSQEEPGGIGPPRPGNQARNQNVRAIQEKGRQEWKQESGYTRSGYTRSGYTRRSLSETGFFRLKTIFGDKLHTRELQNQFVEMFIDIRLLNTRTHLGMPDTVFVPA